MGYLLSRSTNLDGQANILTGQYRSKGKDSPSPTFEIKDPCQVFLDPRSPVEGNVRCVSCSLLDEGCKTYPLVSFRTTTQILNGIIFIEIQPDTYPASGPVYTKNVSVNKLDASKEKLSKKRKYDGRQQGPKSDYQYLDTAVNLRWLKIGLETKERGTLTIFLEILCFPTQSFNITNRKPERRKAIMAMKNQLHISVFDEDQKLILCQSVSPGPRQVHPINQHFGATTSTCTPVPEIPLSFPFQAYYRPLLSSLPISIPPPVMMVSPPHPHIIDTSFKEDKEKEKENENDDENYIFWSQGPSKKSKYQEQEDEVEAWFDINGDPDPLITSFNEAFSGIS